MATFLKKAMDDGSTRWRVTVGRGGTRRAKTFLLRADADAWAKQEERHLERAAAGLREAAKGVTLSTVLDLDEAARAALKRQPGRATQAVLARWRRDHGDLPVEALTRDWVVRWGVARKGEGVHSATVQADLSALTAVLRTVADLHNLDLDRVLAGLDEARRVLRRQRVVGRSRERTRRPTQDEIEKLLAHYGRTRWRRPEAIPMRDVTLFALATGLRAGEIVGVLWSDLDEAHRTILVRARKHPDAEIKEQRDEIVALPTGALIGGEDALEIVRRQPSKGKSERIFPFRREAVSNAHWLACRELGIADLHFHDLRAEFVTRALAAGVDAMTVATQSGHRDMRVMKRYARLGAADLLAAEKRVAALTQPTEKPAEEPAS